MDSTRLFIDRRLTGPGTTSPQALRDLIRTDDALTAV